MVSVSGAGPYCILSAPRQEPVFDLLVQVVPQGPLHSAVPPLLATLGGKRFYLAGNGAMLEEMSLALSDMGVDQKFIYEEPYFNGSHDADPQVVGAIRERFVATDLFSAYANRRQTAFDLDLGAARTGKGGRRRPAGGVRLFDLMPAFLSHHPDHDEPQPIQSERPWGRG